MPGAFACCLAVAFATNGLLLAQEFETPPVLNAADILSAEWLKSDLHQVDPEVTVKFGLDQFVIRTSQGTQEVQGIEQLKKRVREIHATAALDKKRLGGAAIKGMVDESVDTAKTVGGALKKPVRTIFNIPKGLGSIVKRSAGSVENKAKADGNYTGGPVQDWFEVSEPKLDLAAKLGVDPYTDYKPLQKEMNRLAGTSAVGGIGLRLLVPFDGLLAAADAGDLASKLNDVYRTAPSLLYQENLKMLREAGISKDRATRFLGHPVYSPADQSLIIRAIAAMGKPAGVEGFLDAAELIEDRNEGFLFRRSTELLRQHHEQGQKLVGLAGFAGYPAAISQEKRFVLPVYIDHVYWTQMAPGFVDALRTGEREAGCIGTDLLISGKISPRAEQELKARGFRLIEVAKS